MNSSDGPSPQPFAGQTLRIVVGRREKELTLQLTNGASHQKEARLATSSAKGETRLAVAVGRKRSEFIQKVA